MTDDDNDARLGHGRALVEFVTDLGAMCAMTPSELRTLLSAVGREERWLVSALSEGHLKLDSRVEVLLGTLPICASILVMVRTQGQLGAILAAGEEISEEEGVTMLRPKEDKSVGAPLTLHEELRLLELESAARAADFQAAVSAHWALVTGRIPAALVEATGDPGMQARFAARAAALQLAVDEADQAALTASVNLNEFRSLHAEALHPRSGEGPWARSMREAERLADERVAASLRRLGVKVGAS